MILSDSINFTCFNVFIKNCKTKRQNFLVRDYQNCLRLPGLPKIPNQRSPGVTRDYQGLPGDYQGLSGITMGFLSILPRHNRQQNVWLKGCYNVYVHHVHGRVLSCMYLLLYCRNKDPSKILVNDEDKSICSIKSIFCLVIEAC